MHKKNSFSWKNDTIKLSEERTNLLV